MKTLSLFHTWIPLYRRTLLRVSLGQKRSEKALTYVVLLSYSKHELDEVWKSAATSFTLKNSS